MLLIIHRVNTIHKLKTIPYEYGVEIDVRGYGDKLLLSHEPIVDLLLDTYDELEAYLASYAHRFVVFNMKEAGYEDRVIDLAKKYAINDFFLLDVEFPYIYKVTREHQFRKIAIRYSEAEPIASVEAQMEKGNPLVDWVWIDTNTILPLDASIIEKLKVFKTCLVSPDRWGRPGDRREYIERMKQLSFIPDAVMVGFEYVDMWRMMS